MSKIRLNVNVEKGLYKDLRQKLLRQDVTVTEFIIGAITDYVEQKDDGSKTADSQRS